MYDLKYIYILAFFLIIYLVISMYYKKANKVENFKDTILDIKKIETFEDTNKNIENNEAKNNLEGYCYSVRKTFDEEKLKAEFTEEEKTNVLAKVDESLEWLNSNPSASIDDYSTRLKELEDLFNPIM